MMLQFCLKIAWKQPSLFLPLFCRLASANLMAVDQEDSVISVSSVLKLNVWGSTLKKIYGSFKLRLIKQMKNFITVRKDSRGPKSGSLRHSHEAFESFHNKVDRNWSYSGDSWDCRMAVQNGI